MVRAIHACVPRYSPFVSVNHTNYQHLCQLPVSVSLEIKRTGKGWDEELVQHGVWVTAHFMRLAILLDELRDELRLRRL
jgi:hypothetical protein